MEKLTQVPIRSFPKTQVPSVIQIEAHGAKNKNFKPQVLKRGLTFNYIDVEDFGEVIEYHLSRYSFLFLFFFFFFLSFDC
jgi:hypothetical protein